MKLSFTTATLAAAAMLASPALGQTVVVNDSFSDGNRAVTGTGTGDIEAPFFATSASNAIESNLGSVGLVSGSSGRQIHTIFPTQTLGTANDSLTSSVTFTTPATVLSSTGGASSDDLRIGLFDNLGRTGLSADISASSGTPNPLLIGLPGYAIELDVDPNTVANQDLDIRRSDPSTTGRLLGTNSGIPSIGSGSDLGYVFAPNTEYTLVINLARNAADELVITTTFSDPSGVIGTHTETDAVPNSYSFGLLGLGASTNAFGSSNSVDAPDNGIEITNVTVESSIAVVPEPASFALLAAGAGLLISRRRKG